MSGGRRPGESGTRDAILAAARAAFAERGFDRATIRGIAAEAGVDPALVLHYFAAKDKLFAAALDIPVAPADVLRQAAASDPARIGEVVVRAFLGAWEPPEDRQRLVAMVRSAMTNEIAMTMVREYLERRIFGPIVGTMQVPDAQLRATLVGSQFVGLAMVRYIACIEPLASASVDAVVAAVAPTIQRYFTGDLGVPG